jgi:hypothetical protein
MEDARRFPLLPVLAAFALALAVVTVWATAAWAAGGSSADTSSSGEPVAQLVQEDDSTPAPAPGDCPDDGGSGSGGSGSSGSSGSSDT